MSAVAGETKGKKNDSAKNDSARKSRKRKARDVPLPVPLLVPTVTEEELRLFAAEWKEFIAQPNDHFAQFWNAKRVFRWFVRESFIGCGGALLAACKQRGLLVDAVTEAQLHQFANIYKTYLKANQDPKKHYTVLCQALSDFKYSVKSDYDGNGSDLKLACEQRGILPAADKGKANKGNSNADEGQDKLSDLTESGALVVGLQLGKPSCDEHLETTAFLSQIREEDLDILQREVFGKTKLQKLFDNVFPEQEPLAPGSWGSQC